MIVVSNDDAIFNFSSYSFIYLLLFLKTVVSFVAGCLLLCFVLFFCIAFLRWHFPFTYLVDV